jgi:hypothetical protein
MVIWLQVRPRQMSRMVLGVTPYLGATVLQRRREPRRKLSLWLNLGRARKISRTTSGWSCFLEEACLVLALGFDFGEERGAGSTLAGSEGSRLDDALCPDDFAVRRWLPFLLFRAYDLANISNNVCRDVGVAFKQLECFFDGSDVLAIALLTGNLNVNQGHGLFRIQHVWV